MKSRRDWTVARWAGIACCLGGLLLGPSLFAAGGASAASTPEPERAVQTLNEWRALVGVMPVSHDPEQTDGCRAHAEYYRQTGETGHYEDPSKPGYSDAGAKAAASSVLTYGGGDSGPYAWENAVYHRTSLLNPRLATTGFWNEHSLGCMGVFGIDQSRTAPALTVYPYPYDGQVGVETTFGCNELPNPCTSVVGNSGGDPTGFIPSVQFNGPWRYISGPEVTSAQLVPDGGSPTDITVEDRDSGQGGSLDGGFDIIPSRPLAEGTWYTASAEGLLKVSSEGFEEDAAVPFSVKWRFQTQVIPVPPRDPDLRLGFLAGRPRVSSRNPAPVQLVIQEHGSTRRLSLPLLPAAKGLYEATAPTSLRSVLWRVCAAQSAEESAAWKAARICQQGRPIKLQVTILYAGSDFVRLRIKAPAAARGRRAIVSMLSGNGSMLDRARVVLRRKSKLDLRGARGRRRVLRISVRPFRNRGIPQRVMRVVKQIR